MTLQKPPVFMDVVEEHFDELDFLLELREANLFDPDWTLPDLAAHEERMEAHLDGLRIAELHGVDLATGNIDQGEVFAAAASTLVLHESGESESREVILETLQTGAVAVVEGIRLGLRQCDPEPYREVLEGLLGGGDPARAGAAADILAFHRLPVHNLQDLLARGDPGLRIRAASASARLGVSLPREIARAVEAPEPDVRRAALEAACRLGVPGLLRHCRAAAGRETDPDPEAAAFLGVLGDPADLDLLVRLLERPDTAPAAIEALGALGAVAGIRPLLDLLEDGELGGLALAAYRRITGAPDPVQAPPTPTAEENAASQGGPRGNEVAEEITENDQDSGERTVDTQAVREDWRRRERQMDAGTSWQGGIPVATETFPPAGGSLSLQARRDLYLRLRARHGNAVPDVELEAPVPRQLAMASGG